ncbi:MAG TPA: DUF4350 domain-containing protein [Vicinamibacterales bacterium]|nr:DUF4350 domain-containing protein [Vicinamibacterales bacterium]
MSRRTITWSVALGVPLAFLVYWIASNTYWADTIVPMPFRGEAATNPHYAAQRFVEALGGRATRDRTFSVPASDAVIVLSTWNWNLSTRRREALERWVESGGRLVVDGTVFGGQEFARWSGIRTVERPRPPAGQDAAPPGPCFSFLEERRAGQSRAFERPHWICEIDPEVGLTTSRDVDWALDEPLVGRQALRVAVGRGRVTVINAEPFRSRRLFDGDHGWLLAAAAELRPGDHVHFLTEGEYPPLLALVWQNGAPVVVLGLTVLGLVLWRGGVRIGPLAAAAAPVRRSLAEQIRGTGRFALLHDGGEPLHAAAARALDEAARKRVGGYAALAPRDRVAALAGLAGVAPAALDAALHDSRERSPHELRATVALLETVRRSLIRQKRTGHGIS